MRRAVGRIAGITVAAMLAAHVIGCEVDTELEGLTFRLPDGGRFDLPGADGASPDVSTATPSNPDATADGSTVTMDSGQDAGGGDAAKDATGDAVTEAGFDASTDAASPTDGAVFDVAIPDVFVLDADVAQL